MKQIRILLAVAGLFHVHVKDFRFHSPLPQTSRNDLVNHWGLLLLLKPTEGNQSSHIILINILFITLFTAIKYNGNNLID